MEHVRSTPRGRSRRGKLRGIGCAVFIEPSGGGASPKEEVAIQFGASGNARVYALAGPSGQGHETVFPEIVAEVLGMDARSISLRASDPHGPPLVGGGHHRLALDDVARRRDGVRRAR